MKTLMLAFQHYSNSLHLVHPGLVWLGVEKRVALRICGWYEKFMHLFQWKRAMTSKECFYSIGNTVYSAVIRFGADGFSKDPESVKVFQECSSREEANALLSCLNG